LSLAACAGGAAQPARSLAPDPRVFFWATSLTWTVLLVWQSVTKPTELTSHALDLTPWVLLLCIVNLLPVTSWRYAYFTPDTPILVAGMVVLSPLQIGFSAFISCLDLKELRGETTVSKALCNRSQVALAAYCGGFAAHAVSKSPNTSGLVLAIAFLSLAVLHFVNYSLVGMGVSLERSMSFFKVLSRLQVGSFYDFVFTNAAWGVIGAMLAVLYDQVRPLALLAFLGLSLLGRRTLSRSQNLADTTNAYVSGQMALSHMDRQIQEERTDERKLIAADLHDEVLQPLYKVSLMAHVLKADLESGRLLEMDRDLPELLGAAEVASQTLRDLIRDLRRSTLGRGGLAPALSSFMDSLARQTTSRIHSSIQLVEIDAVRELALYQIAREALSNAATHSRASNIYVELACDPDLVRLTITDDGTGFDTSVAKEGHYGIPIMKERARSIGAELYLDSFPGKGCVVTIQVPSHVENS